MAQEEGTGTLASNESPVASEKTIFLDCAGVMQNAETMTSAAGRLSFEFEPSLSASLFQFGNTGDFDKPQRVAALDLGDANLVRVELLHAKAEISNGFVVFLMLFCDANGRVIGRQRLPFWPAPAQAEYTLPAGTATASFAVRLAGSGFFEELKLRAIVLRDRGAEIMRQSTFTFVLRIPPPEKSDRWLDLVPKNLRIAIAGDVVAAQQLGIVKLRRDAGSAGARRDIRPSLEDALERMLRAFQEDGLMAAIGQAVYDAPDPTTQSRLLEDFATRIESIDRDAALRAYWFAYGTRPDSTKAQKLALKMFKSGNISSAASLFKKGPQDSPSVLGPELQLCARLFEKLPTVPPRAIPETPLDGGLAYVASSAVPYLTSGYTVRTHELLTALRHSGLDVRCAVRPGFPWDRSATISIKDAVPEHQQVGNVPYFYARLEPDGQHSHVIERTAAELERRFRQWRPRIVQAASNHRNAFPALIAARRIGAAFIYEVRGLWELTAATTNPGWEKTERFALERRLELTIASAADRVLTITQGVANELIGSGVDPHKIELLPNAVDTDLFQPIPKDAELSARFELAAFDLCVVYAGALVLYEGLDDLIRAIAVLRGKGLRVRFIVVGDGAFRPSLQELTTSLNLDDRITFVGQVPPASVPRYWSLADAVVLPRKPFKVCKVVSPLKPFEAMAMSKVVVLSDLPVMREIVQDDKTGLLCRFEDPIHIAKILERIIGAPELRTRLGEEARKWILKERTWTANSRRLQEIHQKLLSSGTVA
jgi:glycosyltransferase involved in cell wall biosynthesis